jgi:hypothetical protein
VQPRLGRRREPNLIGEIGPLWHWPTVPSIASPRAEIRDSYRFRSPGPQAGKEIMAREIGNCP